MTVLTGKQQGVLRGMVAAVVVTIAALVAAVCLTPTASLPDATFPGAVRLALRCDVAVIACLAGSIGVLARHRFFTPEDIDGGGLTAGTPTAHRLQSELQNTLEQAVLAVGAHLAWAVTTPVSWQGAVPVAAALFVVGRILFWRGYALGAASRALGFALTFYPSVGMLIVALGALARDAVG